MEADRQNGRETPVSDANTPTTRPKRQDIDWGKFGLAEKSSYEPKRGNGRDPNATNGGVYPETERGEVTELFDEDGELHQRQEPWWKSSFFITRTIHFGTWDGVFTSCLMNIVGVVIFLRTGWMVGYAGIGLSLLVVLMSLSIALATVMSAVGIYNRCDVKHGGVYFIVSHVLGGKIGGSIGLIYCLGHAVATAMYCIGFAESLATLVKWNNTWAIRSIGLVVLLALLTIAISGVKWVIRFQLVLVLILAVAVLDFIIGTLVHEDPVNGFTGFSNKNFNQNSKPTFTEKVHFFTVFGVFFPAACGVMSGVNMSGELKDPGKSIPLGSTAAIGVTGGFYVIFIFLLGATCTRDALRDDNMIMQKMSVIGFLFLLGLYVSSLSSVLGGVVGPPRVLQKIAEDNILPILKPFAKRRASNNEPQNATFLIAFIAILFILIGKLNTLATIVTMPFLLTYIVINYAYFALAMSYELKQKQKAEKDKDNYGLPAYLSKKSEKCSSLNGRNDPEKTPLIEDAPSYGSQDNEKEDVIGSNQQPVHSENARPIRDPSLKDPGLDPIPNDIQTGDKQTNEEFTDHEDKEPGTENQKGQRDSHEQPRLEFVKDKEPDALYARLCNRWVSLITSGVALILMFCISWSYALASISFTLLLYIFISQSNPGSSLGVASDFSFSKWLKSFGRFQSKNKDERQIVVHRGFIPYGISMYQMTQDNSDYAFRDRKHHSSVITKPVPYD